MKPIEDIFEECLQAIEAGDTLEACLARYPEYADELRPLLELALDLQQTPKPRLSPEAFHGGYERVVQAAHAKREASAPSQAARALPFPRWRWLAAAAVFVALFITSTITADRIAADSLPGEPLYAVKQFSEWVRLITAITPEQRANAHALRAERRLQETIELLQRGQAPDPALLDAARREVEKTVQLATPLSESEREQLLQRWQDELATLEQLSAEMPTAPANVPETIKEIETTLPQPPIVRSPTPTLSDEGEPGGAAPAPTATPT
ncbi:MAG: hypothetical protein D6802_12445, partial [Ardenticatenia bacterium]